MTQDRGRTTALTASGNWLDGGWCTVNLSSKGLDRLDGIRVTGNRFGRGSRYADCAVITAPGDGVVLADNVWDDDGRPARVRRG